MREKEKKIKKENNGAIPSPMEMEVFASGYAKKIKAEKALKNFEDFHLLFMEAEPNLVVRTRENNRAFYLYKDGRYKRLNDIEIKDMIFDFMDKNQMEGFRNSDGKMNDTMKRLGMYLANTERNVTDEQIETQKHYINIKNGLLDPRTGILHDHTPDYFSIGQAPIVYDPENTEMPKFQKFLDDSTQGSEEDMLTIQEMAGYCLLKGNPRHKIFFIYGQTARNGKSTLMKTIANLIGRENFSSLPIEDIIKGGHQLTALVDKQLNTSDEVSTKFFEASAITTLTSEGFITINPKNKEPYSYQVTTKFIACCNDLPRFQEAQGMKHRMVIIPINNHVPESKRIDRLDEKFIAEEGTAILNWALAGLKRLEENKFVFTQSEQAKEERSEYEKDIIPTYAFLENNFIIDGDSDSVVYIEDIYGEPKTREHDQTGFRLWCEKRGIGAVSQTKFSRDIAKYAKEKGTILQRRDSEMKRVYSGLRKNTTDPNSVFYVVGNTDGFDN